MRVLVPLKKKINVIASVYIEDNKFKTKNKKKQRKIGIALKSIKR